MQCCVTPCLAQPDAAQHNTVHHMQPSAMQSTYRCGMQARRGWCDLLHNGAGVHCAAVGLVRVIVHSFLWHIVGLAQLRSLSSHNSFVSYVNPQRYAVTAIVKDDNIDAGNDVAGKQELLSAAVSVGMGKDSSAALHILFPLLLRLLSKQFISLLCRHS